MDIENGVKTFITVKGKAADVAKVFAALEDGSPARQALGEAEEDCYGEVKIETVELNPETNSIELGIQSENAYYIYENREEFNSFINAIHSLAKPFLIDPFPNVSFFVATGAQWDETYEHGGAFACAYTIFEKGSEVKRETWNWVTMADPNDYSNWDDEMDHYRPILELRLEWIEKRCALWFVEGTEAAAEAGEALVEAERQAVEADVAFTSDQDEDE